MTAPRRKVGIREVAALAEVASGTVSHYLNRPDRVSAEKAQRIRRAIDTLGFVPNHAGRQLRLGRSDAVAYLAPDVSNPFFAAVAEGVERRAAAAGLSVFIANTHATRDREDAYLRQFEQHRVRGLLVASHEPMEERLAHLRERGTPSVLLGRAAAGSAQPSVAVDEVMGGRLAARHLLELGRRRLAFVGGPLRIRQAGDRLQGAGDAVRESGAGSLEVLTTTVRTIAAGRAVAAELLARPATRRPDAVVAVNDLVALGLLQALVAAGVRVPEDVAVIGYDDIEFAAASLIPLSSIRAPQVDFGAAAVDLLLGLLDGTADDTQRTYPPELVVRASTRPQEQP
ncbi:LacI family transcriptional regulator [Jiangella ureilytica]|uniref:LacI family transcriptional regulator n=1 Tax=Jiangella ureilytica TaxID=2530374 RepID=A0A4R4RNB9_9ACTN|nr:substrate-binding domain-containing protein [Jiangella ureilytica]TDC50926.1 LacI family transcriptional regulator [Jiangella ureilytica]